MDASPFDDFTMTSLPPIVGIGALTRPALLAALRAHGIQLNPAAEALFEDPRFTTLPQHHLVPIAARSVAELGFDHGATYAQLIERAHAAGLLECPLELGPHLRTQFLDQPDEAAAGPLTHGRAPPGSITVASAPLDDTDATPKGFYLRHADGVLWLRGYWSSSDHHWSPDDVFIFSKRPPT